MSDKSQDSDILYDEDESRDSFGRSGKDKKLKEKLKKCEEERGEYLAGWQRAKADLVNQRKEFEERSAAVGTFAKEGLIIELLGVLDSFEMAFKNKEKWEEVDENWRKGVEYIHTQLDTTLHAHGLTRIEAVGNTFEPMRHESVETLKTDEEEKGGLVAEVVQSGYMMEDKVIRAAKVKVYEYQ